jgi:hypothetical protein
MSLSQFPAYVGPKKRKKTSGLTKSELRKALTSLQSVKTSLKEITVAKEPDVTNGLQSQGELVVFGSDFEEVLDGMLEMMQSKLDGPHVRHVGGLSAFRSQTRRFFAGSFLL